jgi:hypothetical protein
MNGALIADMLRFDGQPGVTITSSAERMELRIARSGMIVSIVVPRAALEFFIEVRNERGVRLIEDWLDYAGFDARPEDQLAEEMRAEVLQFAERLMSRSLRLAPADGSLEWQSGERWLQAVPFVPDTERRGE